jgi:hypothetical protein
MWHGKDFCGSDEDTRRHSQERESGKCLRLGLGRLGFKGQHSWVILDILLWVFFHPGDLIFKVKDIWFLGSF